ncbi:hypothetical protein HPB47_007889 [Ixodes persulcatus]|uniref:Uncharacterized protein n=1 Tax=Ixodes persulcatus TaxID=34615 RepID=A0AC60P6N7_IXOPE|nr:hypothetical protein HPB47_007889 [Ixodes persulcatus]
MTLNQANFRPRTSWTEEEASAKNPMPLNGFLATPATHGQNQQVSLQPSFPNGYDSQCPECNRGTPSRSAPAFIAAPNPLVTFEVNTAAAQNSCYRRSAPIGGPTKRENPPAAHAESDSHHRQDTLGAYHPLLENAARVIESLTGALQTTVRPPPLTRPPVRIPIPTYRGYGDRVCATDFLEDLKKYQQAMGMSDHEILYTHLANFVCRPSGAVAPSTRKPAVVDRAIPQGTSPGIPSC